MGRLRSKSSGCLPTFEDGEEWIKKQEQRTDFCVLDSGCSYRSNGKYKAYVSGYRIDPITQILNSHCRPS